MSPFAPRALPRFHATMETSDFCSENCQGLGHDCSPLSFEPRSFDSARLRTDLLCSVTGLLYMPWPRTPVVPASRLMLPSLLHTWSATTEISRLSELNTFTLVALRPAQSLFTLRLPPRDGKRKTRYWDLMVFPQAGLTFVSRRSGTRWSMTAFTTHIVSSLSGSGDTLAISLVRGFARALDP